MARLYPNTGDTSVNQFGRIDDPILEDDAANMRYVDSEVARVSDFPSRTFSTIANLEAGIAVDGTLPETDYDRSFFAVVTDASGDPDITEGAASYALTTLPASGIITTLAGNWTRLSNPDATDNICLTLNDGSTVNLGSTTSGASGITESAADIRYLRIDNNNSAQSTEITDAEAAQARRNIGITTTGGAENFRGLSDVRFEGAVNNWGEPSFNGMELSQANFSDYSTDYTTSTNTLRFGIDADSNFQISELVQDFAVGTPIRIRGATNTNFPSTTNLFGTVTSAQATAAFGNFPAQIFLRIQFPNATDQPQQQGAWVSGNDYVVGDVVQVSTNYFRAEVDITNSVITPSNGTEWKQIPTDVDTALGARFAQGSGQTIPSSGGIGWFLAQGQYQLDVSASSAQQDAFTRGLVENIEIRSTRTTNHRFLVYRDDISEVEVIGTPDFADFLQTQPSGELSVSTQFPSAPSGIAGQERTNQVPTVRGLDNYMSNRHDRNLISEVTALVTPTVVNDGVNPQYQTRPFSGWLKNVTTGSTDVNNNHLPGLYTWTPRAGQTDDNVNNPTAVGDYTRLDTGLNVQDGSTTNEGTAIKTINFNTGLDVTVTGSRAVVNASASGNAEQQLHITTTDLPETGSDIPSSGNLVVTFSLYTQNRTLSSNTLNDGANWFINGRRADTVVSGQAVAIAAGQTIDLTITWSDATRLAELRTLGTLTTTFRSDTGPNVDWTIIRVGGGSAPSTDTTIGFGDVVTNFVDVGGISTTASYNPGSDTTDISFPTSGFNAAEGGNVLVGSLIASNNTGPWFRITQTNLTVQAGGFRTGTIIVAGDASSLASQTGFHIATQFANTGTSSTPAFDSVTLGDFRVSQGDAFIGNDGTSIGSGNGSGGSYSTNGQLLTAVIISGTRTGDIVMQVTASGNSGLAVGNYLVNIVTDGGSFSRVDNIRGVRNGAITTIAAPSGTIALNAAFTLTFRDVATLRQGGLHFTNTTNNSILMELTRDGIVRAAAAGQFNQNL